MVFNLKWVTVLSMLNVNIQCQFKNKREQHVCMLELTDVATFI
jgi:hypothetical protein